MFLAYLVSATCRFFSNIGNITSQVKSRSRYLNYLI